MIGEYPDRQAPNIVRHNGKVGIIGKDDGADFGFLLTPASAVEVAVKLLAAVADLAEDNGDRTFGHDVDSINFKAANFANAQQGVITLTIGGAPVRGFLTPTQIAEMAVAFTAASNWLDDTPVNPRHDR